MNNIEETLWNYIDGNCTTGEQKAISVLIEHDETYQLKYKELLNLNQEFMTMDLDEPSMAFTYNVMETIRNQNAQQPLKAAINKRIIMGITLFFVLTILVLLMYTLSNINWTATAAPAQLPIHIKIPAISNLITKPIKQGFLFFDVVLALFLFDTYLRNKKETKQA